MVGVPVASEGPSSRGKAGRPRDPRVDEAILSATLGLLAEQGYARLTMEGVALRAGVAKTSLYRRWSTKDSLVLDAVSDVGLAERPDVPDTGDLHQDMLLYLKALVRFRRGKAWASEVLSNVDLKQVFRERLGADLTSGFRTIVERAVERSELAPGTDVELMANLPMALIHEHRVLTGQPADEALARRIADQFFRTGDRIRPG